MDYKIMDLVEYFCLLISNFSDVNGGFERGRKYGFFLW